VTSQPSQPDLPGRDGGADGDAGPIGTGSNGTRLLGILTLAGIALGAYMALHTSPPDANMGNAVRLIYIHVPIVTMAYVGCGLCTIGSAMYLWKKSVWWDITAAASAELALVFTALTLVIGMIWGKPTWGVFWVWDPRLTSTAMLGLLLLGYSAVRRLPTEPTARSRRAAIVGLLLVPNVIIVNRSVTWWRSLHQGTTILNTLQPKIHDQMAFTLVFCMFVVAMLFAWLLIHRWRLAWLEHQLEEAELDQAISARRAEAARPATAPNPTPAPAPAPAPRPGPAAVTPTPTSAREATR
jgi:heme exporter protein C